MPGQLSKVYVATFAHYASPQSLSMRRSACFLPADILFGRMLLTFTASFSGSPSAPAAHDLLPTGSRSSVRRWDEAAGLSLGVVA